MKKIILYTDGACSGNPGKGGWGAYLIYDGHDYEKKFSGYEPETTNNRMELTAVIEGLKKLNIACEVEVYTDSAYVCNAFEQNWIETWKVNGFKNASKKQISNIDLWQELLKQCEKHKVHFNKVKGHADNALNNECDRLATDEIKKHS